MASPGHQAKRPYAGTHSHNHNQPAITSYFPASANAQHVDKASRTADSSSSSMAPPLPDAVQSNLLSVGMRVRKSVPEGYKTGSFSALGLFSDNTLAGSQADSTVVSSRQGRRGYRTKELTPFCGILKTGGMAQQELVDDMSDGEDGVPEEDDVPMLSSQDSTISSASVGSASALKRRLDEVREDDGDRAGTPRSEGWSPKSRPSYSRDMALSNRHIAVPKTRRKRSEVGGFMDVRVVGQDNTMDDFEEAQFLDYSTWHGREVEMRDA